MGLSARVLSPQTARGVLLVIFVILFHLMTCSAGGLVVGELFVGQQQHSFFLQICADEGLQIILSARDRDLLLRTGAEFKIL